MYLAIDSPSDASSLQKDLNLQAIWDTKWKNGISSRKNARLSAKVDVANKSNIDITSMATRWNKHVSSIVCKANHTHLFLKRNLQINDTNLKTIAYQTLVRPSSYSQAASRTPTPKRIKSAGNYLCVGRLEMSSIATTIPQG